MKKIILCLFLLFSINNCFANDYTSYCSTSTASKNVTGNIASLTGFNFLTRNIIESQIAKAIKTETNSKFDVSIDGFYGVNFLSGEFKNIKATAKNFSYDGLYLSDLTVESICPYNHVSFEDDKLVFLENMVLKYQTNITQDDLNKILSSSKYQKIINKMNSDKLISSFVQIKASNIEILKDKLQLKYTINPLPKDNLLSSLAKTVIKPIDLSFGANLQVKDNKLDLYNFETNSIKTSYQNILPFINKLNPLSYNVDIDKNNKADLKIENVKIEDNKIVLDGVVIINKN